MRFLGREIRLGVERADRAAYESDCVSPDFNEVVRQIAGASGLEIDYAQAVRLWDAWNLGGLTLGRTMFDDAFPTLDWLRDHGCRLGCVTNRVFGGPRFVEELHELGLDRYFDATAVSCDIGYMKPHPKIFEHVFEAMQIDPRETAMVGDSLRADVEAAQTLGMTAIWRRIKRPDRKHAPEEVGEGPAGSQRPATRAETGRALGEFARRRRRDAGLRDLAARRAHHPPHLRVSLAKPACRHVRPSPAALRLLPSAIITKHRREGVTCRRAR